MQPGERLKESRKKIGIKKQKDLAKIMGISSAYISDIECGKVMPSTNFLVKLKKTTGISTDYILYGSPEDQVEIKFPNGPIEYAELEKKMMLFGEKEVRYQILPTIIKKLLDNVKEILESDNKVMIDALKANIKAFLEAIRISKGENRNKTGGD